MGTKQTITPSKSEKSSSIVQEQPSVHPYPDWASMQAYYGPGVPIAAPYFSAAVAPGHTHPYMWSPQPMLTPFGGPYTAICPHGLYPHPSATHIASPVNPEVSAILSINKERGSEKKIKGLDKFSTSIGNGIVKGPGRNENISSESGDNEAEGSSYGSDLNSESGGSERKRNKSSEAIPNSASKNAFKQANIVNLAAADASPTISFGMKASTATIIGKSVCAALSANLTPGVDLRSSCISKLKPGGEQILSTTTAIEERELKQERRKQSNRESARRSRLRKQAETEELAIKVGTLTAENATLRSEITLLIESSDKLRLQNSALMEKLRMVQLAQEEDTMSDRIDDNEAPSIVIRNLLSRIDNSSSPVCDAYQMEDESYDSSSGKLQQLLDSNTKSDSLTAS